MSLLTAEKKIDSVRKRTGEIVAFDLKRIEHAISGAFQEQMGSQQIPEDVVSKVVKAVEAKLKNERSFDAVLDVERIQDSVELILMRLGHYEVARCYIIYREAHTRVREKRKEKPLLHKLLQEACQGLEATCSFELLQQRIQAQLFKEITAEQTAEIALLTAREMVEKEPAYDKVASRLLLSRIHREMIGVAKVFCQEALQAHFSNYIKQAIEKNLLCKEMAEFNLGLLAKSLDFSRDALFPYQGLQILYDRYLIRSGNSRIECPQYFWMRVAMGLALEEEAREEKACAFYEIMSTFRYVPSTPTLFNSGSCHPQLSSCYLSTVQDDLGHIFKVIGDDAKLSKWAGGIGNDWTAIRATGARIEGTKGTSQGVIPFLKIVNDTALAVNQGGKRKGAICCYLETWHLDIEEFLDLRKNTGDERRRAHDMNTANWIPDLFMKRVINDEIWTLFSPDEVPDLHDLYGEAFEKRYCEYEAQAKKGTIRQHRQIQAKTLWRKMLSRLFETGHPWITWKDPSNLRSMQPHTGVIHSSNLCTEILLNTSPDETAVCNLGSINLPVHIQEGQLNKALLEQTVTTAIRMLDNVIDINFYPTQEAKNSNLRHRPIGLGMMGFQDALFALCIPYDSEGAIAFADRSCETISYLAIRASIALAKERGHYPTYPGSRWSQGQMPIDTLLHSLDKSSTLDWESLRKQIKEKGIRNCQVMAIAPTATISVITGTSASIEPLYSCLFVKSNLSGDFTSVNTNLVKALKALNLWDQEMLDELKYHDGSIQEITRIPQSLKALFKTAFEIEPKWLITAAARRQKWIDQGQSLNLYLNSPSGKALDEMYQLAWKLGLKTTYYLRTKAATQVEKSTLDINKYGIQPKWMQNKSASSSIQVTRSCSLEDGCEACQ